MVTLEIRGSLGVVAFSTDVGTDHVTDSKSKIGNLGNEDELLDRSSHVVWVNARVSRTTAKARNEGDGQDGSANVKECIP